MLTAILQSVILGWLWRRAQELASVLFALVPLYASLPPDIQHNVQVIFSGGAGGLSISAYFGIAYYLFTQLQSFRATVRPQVVTNDGKKLSLEPGTVAQANVERQARVAPKRRTLWDMLTSQ